MPAIGFRAEKDKFHWAVVELTNDEPVLIDDGKTIAPTTFHTPAALTHFRTSVINLLSKYKPTAAGIKESETFIPRKPNPAALGSMFARARIEGVIIEALNSAGKTVISGGLRKISSEMGSKSAKGYLESENVRGLDMSSKSALVQEAIVAAIAAMEAK